MISEAQKKDNYRFGGMREVVLKRDGYTCVNCGMTDDEHRALWGKSLTVNHKNGHDRRRYGQPDNSLQNLETLCLRCHGAKDGKRWNQKTVRVG